MLRNMGLTSRIAGSTPTVSDLEPSRLWLPDKVSPDRASSMSAEKGGHRDVGIGEKRRQFYLDVSLRGRPIQEPLMTASNLNRFGGNSRRTARNDPTRPYANQNLDMSSIDVIGFDLDAHLASHQEMNTLSIQVVDKLISMYYPGNGPPLCVSLSRSNDR